MTYFWGPIQNKYLLLRHFITNELIIYITKFLLLCVKLSNVNNHFSKYYLINE